MSHRLSNGFDNRLNVCIHDTTGCQTGLTTGLTTDCIVYTAGCQTGCTIRFDNRFNEQWLFVQHGCQTGCETGLATGLTTVGCLFTRYSRLSNRLYNRFDNRLYRVNGVLLFMAALWFLSSFFFFSSPNLSCRRLDVFHTSTHGVALVRI